LYFKSLIRLNKPSYPEKHDLVDLFSEIDRLRREKITRYFRDNSAHVREYIKRQAIQHGKRAPKVTVNYVLSVSRDAFIIMRYPQGVPAGSGWLAFDVMEGAWLTILKEHPDWERLRQTEPVIEFVVESTSPTH
jgi:hypothetical protein